ncbi:methionine aminotransferase [Flavobacterium magnum]|uniref:Methionine aminotransferase n=1 Tax=Flavobacterium magnum TaxID=2162713 RepID=A0A2S0RE72_9FLAO|nr:methionine aminotransferase [Flavobacterium magnum]AWA29411.1 methionine aminotransferase [Flavobacterium magnum]
MKNIKSKLPYVTNHIFSEMSALAARHNAINLSQGFPNFEPSPTLQDLVAASLADKSLPLANQYAPMAGLPSLRQSVAKKMNQSYGIAVDWESEITITVGATAAIYNTIAAFVWPGDEVILMEPCYDSYRPAVDMAGGIPVIYEMQAPDFKIDWKVLATLFTPKTRMICICTPNNPTGTVFEPADMAMLSELVRDTDVIVMSDEVYEHMVYNGRVHETPLKYDGLRDRTVSVFSFGKTYHITGWRIGYCIAAPALTSEIRKIHQNSVFSASHPLQQALTRYMDESDDYLSLPVFYQQKRDLFAAAMQPSRFRLLPCHGSYFQLMDYAAISQESDYDFCVRLAREYGVAAIPVSRLHSNFKDNRLIRLCFAKTDETLVAAAGLLCRV